MRYFTRSFSIFEQYDLLLFLNISYSSFDPNMQEIRFLSIKSTKKNTYLVDRYIRWVRKHNIHFKLTFFDVFGNDVVLDVVRFIGVGNVYSHQKRRIRDLFDDVCDKF